MRCHACEKAQHCSFCRSASQNCLWCLRRQTPDKPCSIPKKDSAPRHHPPTKRTSLQKPRPLSLQARFQVADALAMPFADKTFDLVWSMESGEHMPDKRQFVKELARVAAPGGKVIVVTWCVEIVGFRGRAMCEREKECNLL